MARTARLYRRPRGHGGVLLGLCAGLGDHLGLDAAVFRLSLLLLLFLSPAGLAVAFIYIIFALTLPVEQERAAGHGSRVAGDERNSG